MQITKTKVATVAVAVGIAILVLTINTASQAPLNSISGVRDQVMINTARINTLEHDVRQLEDQYANHVDKANSSTTDFYLVKSQVQEMRDGFKWILVLIFGHVIGSSALALKYYISRQVKGFDREKRDNDLT